MKSADGSTRSRRWQRLTVFSVGVLSMITIGVLVSVVRGVHSPRIDELPEHADVLVVFAGEDERLTLAWRLVREGIAPVLVISHGDNHPDWSQYCGVSQPFDVWCLEPSPSNTRGEAQMFGMLANEYGWQSMIAVTANYHVERARTYLRRCFDGDLTFAAVPWQRLNTRVVRHETLGGIQARFLSRGC